MDSLARNALRLSLAGAGMAVLGAGFVGQASAAELPEGPSAPEAPGTSLITDNLPSTEDNDVSMDAGAESDSADAPATEAPTTDGLPSADALPSTDALPSAGTLALAGSLPTTDGLPSTDALPSADTIPSLDGLPAMEVPGAMFLEAPTVS